MADYIRLDTTIMGIDGLINEAPTGSQARALICAKDMIYDQQQYVSEMKPVKRGHWYHNKSKYISELDAYFIQACCSCCGRYSDRIDIYTTTMSNEFCSHCGARMIKDGDAE